MDNILFIILAYFVLPVIIIFGVMYLIRKKREKEAGRQQSNKVKSIKEEETRH